MLIFIIEALVWINRDKKGIEIRRHDTPHTPNIIKEFQTELLYALFNCKDSIAEIVSKWYENCILLVTNTIYKVMTGEGIQQQDLVISKLLRQDIEKYKSLFPHVSAAIQLLSNNVGGVDKHPRKCDTIQYIYTNSEHNNPIYRVVPLELLQKVGEKEKDGKERNTLNYDNEKYREIILYAA
jgi:DNA polymerase elongation subunit (family B)